MANMVDVNRNCDWEWGGKGSRYLCVCTCAWVCVYPNMCECLYRARDGKDPTPPRTTRKSASIISTLRRRTIRVVCQKGWVTGRGACRRRRAPRTFEVYCARIFAITNPFGPRVFLHNVCMRDCVCACVCLCLCLSTHACLRLCLWLCMCLCLYLCLCLKWCIVCVVRGSHERRATAATCMLQCGAVCCSACSVWHICAICPLMIVQSTRIAICNSEVPGIQHPSPPQEALKTVNQIQMQQFRQ